MTGKSKILNLACAAALAAAGVCAPVFAQQTSGSDSGGAGQGAGTTGHVIVTVEPKSHEAAPDIPQSDVLAKVNGKQAEVQGWRKFNNARPDLELILLVDDSARSSLGLHLKEMKTFLMSLPPTTAVAVAYMQNAGPELLHPLTTDHKAAADTLRLPMGVPGGNASPYFILSTLIHRWPDQTPNVRHEVVMISDGVDRYYSLRYDPEDPYVNATIHDAIRGGVIVYSIYYRDTGFASRTMMGINGGQNYLTQLSDETGGQLFYEGFGNPVDMTPFFKSISQKLDNQYELTVTPPNGVPKGVDALKVNVKAPNVKVQAPQRIFFPTPAQ
jgi:VWFA-related protein